jgi:hypothetical protein
LVRQKIPAKRLTYRYFWLRCYAEGLSKAHASALHASIDVLSVETAVLLVVLSRGVARGLRDVILRFDSGGLRRAFAIATRLLFTIAGFCVGKIRGRYADRPTSDAPGAANPLPQLCSSHRACHRCYCTGNMWERLDHELFPFRPGLMKRVTSAMAPPFGPPSVLRPAMVSSGLFGEAPGSGADPFAGL